MYVLVLLFSIGKYVPLPTGTPIEDLVMVTLECTSFHVYALSAVQQTLPIIIMISHSATSHYML